MSDRLQLLAVFAHPDDESFAAGGVLAKYAAEGVATHLLCATRGERGRFVGMTAPAGQERPSLEAVGARRQQELAEAAQVLELRGVRFLDYIDKDLDQAAPAEVIGKIAREFRRIRPQVVITFGPDGGYGHPDHVAISQFTTAALIAAAHADPAIDGEPYAVPKFYYIVWPQSKWTVHHRVLPNMGALVDGVKRIPSPWPDWLVTTRVDTSRHIDQVWRAMNCHATQIEIFTHFEGLSADERRVLWGEAEFYRASSLITGGRDLETDLFAGLR